LGLEERLERLCRGPREKRFRHAHALLGALHQVLLLGGQLHTPQGLFVQLAARAIVTHHDKDAKATVVSDPLAFLLYVSDRLQAWKRPYLYREPPEEDGEPIRIRQIVECQKIALIPDGKGGFVAKFEMNSEEKDWEILKKRFGWSFDEFRKPNQALEGLIRRHGKGMFPRFVLSRKSCLSPQEFLESMPPPRRRKAKLRVH
jgi:hypothetical protein